jgi:preprotein translocase subunit SecD
LAKPVSPARGARRALAGLGVIIVVLLALNFVGVFTATGSTFATKLTSLVPKLGLDLVGGTQIVLKPVPQGGKTVTPDELNQAVAIIQQRVNAAGVSEAQVGTQAPNYVVVSIPGTPSQATLKSVTSSAKMEFRPVLYTDTATSSVVGKNGKRTPGPYTPPASLDTTPSVKPTGATDLNQLSQADQALYTNYQCSQAKTAAAAPASKPLVTCDTTETEKYLLGPVVVEGAHITGATSGLQTTSAGSSTGTWVVDLTLDGTGTTQFAKITQTLVNLTTPQNEFAIVLDGYVIEAPYISQAISNGKAEISGSFTSDSAKALADQLKFGALPVSFTVNSEQSISATLGSASLIGGLIAGLIGLLLVVLYSFFQYRTLGLVTIVSLLSSAILTYLIIDFLSWREGYRLSLAGVAGLIVSIGITADSFIVYFERIRDELREGRPLAGAVEAGWRRARRTIFASDGVNFLAAAVLYVLAIGDVKGFALTLGVTTLVDLVVVTLFTHPTLRLLARLPFFANGHPASGLDPNALGAVYRGRGSFAVAGTAAGAVRTQRSRSEAQRRQTIAERKAAEARGESPVDEEGDD